MNEHIKSLYPFQNRAVKAVYGSMRDHRTTMLQLPTGAGKSHIAAAIMEHGLQHDKRINFLVDRIVLTDQMYDRLWQSGLPVSVMQASHPMYNPSLPIQVVSIQTLARRDRRRWPPADLIMQDEAHIQYAGAYKVMDKWNAIPWIGLSATPFTTGLGLKWENLVVGSTTAELIELGYLCGYEAYGPSKPDLTKMKYSGGDYAINELAERMADLTGDIVTHYTSMAAGRKAICFTPNVAYSEILAAEFKSNGIPADYVSYHDSDQNRYRKMEAYKSGEIEVMMNCDVLTRGLDIPDIEVGILARPTRSLSLHIQMLGRCLRTAEGKQKALYLDHSGNIERLGFPDDDLPMELNRQQKGVSTTDQRDKKEPQPWNCPKCTSLVPPKTIICPACGFKPTPKTEIVVKSGILQRLERNANHSKQDVYSQLCHIQNERGYSQYWASQKYRRVFGVWPRGVNATPKTPTPEMLAWVKSENIRYAKRRQK